MLLRRILIAVVTVGNLVVLGGLALMWRPAIAPVTTSAKTQTDRKAIDHGAELASSGNCADCHTSPNGAAYAGGRPIPTPFGTIYASNLPPDGETGIGSWSEEAFKRAMRDGVDREGRQLYPAFPYDHFTHATDADIHAIFAFWMSRPAVRNAVPANELAFPFSFRPIVAGWKLLFLNRNVLDPDSSKSAEWNRGRYLVEGLGHCGSCHTPKNLLGAEKRGAALAGSEVGGWFAPRLDGAGRSGLRGWSADDIVEYL